MCITFNFLQAQTQKIFLEDYQLYVDTFKDSVLIGDCLTEVEQEIDLLTQKLGQSDWINLVGNAFFSGKCKVIKYINLCVQITSE